MESALIIFQWARKIVDDIPEKIVERIVDAVGRSSG